MICAVVQTLVLLGVSYVCFYNSKLVKKIALKQIRVPYLH